jgi:hypothetical protein
VQEEPFPYNIFGCSALNDYSGLDCSGLDTVENQFSYLAIDGLQNDTFLDTFPADFSSLTIDGLQANHPLNKPNFSTDCPINGGSFTSSPNQATPSTQSLPYQHQITQSRRERKKEIRRKIVLAKFHLSRIGRKGHDVLIFTIDNNGRAGTEFVDDSVPTTPTFSSPTTITDPDIATPNVNHETRCLCGITNSRGNLMIQW